MDASQTNHWLLTADLKNWDIAQDNSVFGCHGNRSFLKKIKKGDGFVAYVPKLGFIGYGEVTSEYFQSDRKIWSDKIYRHRFSISTPFKSNKVLPGPAIVDDLDFVTNKQKWGMFFRSGIRQIPDQDFNKIISSLEKSNSSLMEVKESVLNTQTPQQIGDELHERILNLFRELGFTIIDNNLYKAGPDIIVADPADEAKSKILIQCKNSYEAKKTFKNFDKHMFEYSGRVSAENAQAAILAIGNQELPPKVPGQNGELNTEDILKKYNVAVWDNDLVKYYEDLLKKINHFAKHQLLSDLGIRVNFQDKISVDAVRMEQNGYEVFMTAIQPDWLLKASSVVRRVAQNGKVSGYQRLIDKSRLNPDKPGTISNYISTNSDWFLPNALVLATTDDSVFEYKDGQLEFASHYGQFWVIDGQHRLFAFSTCSKEEREKNIACLIINTNSFVNEADSQKKIDQKKKRDSKLAETFVQLNWKSKKVPKALKYELHDLIAAEDNPELDIVLNLIKDDFFKNDIKSYSDKEGSINLVSFADAKGLSDLYKRMLVDSKNIDNLVNKVTKYLLVYFKIVASVFEKEWSDSDKYFLKTDRGIKGLLVLLVTIYDKCGQNKDEIQKCMIALKESNFDFASDYAKGLYLGAGGPEQLANSFLKHINTNIYNFAPDVSSYAEISALHSEKGSSPDAFYDEWLPKLSGDVRCQMMFIDDSTFDYFSKLNFEKVSRVRIFFGNTNRTKPRVKKEMKNRIEELRSKGLNIILTQSRKKTSHKGGFFHERWIGDDNIKISTEQDLQSKSQASQCNLKVFSWTNHADLENFDKYWNAAELSKDMELDYDWGNES